MILIQCKQCFFFSFILSFKQVKMITIQHNEKHNLNLNLVLKMSLHVIKYWNIIWLFVCLFRKEMKMKEFEIVTNIFYRRTVVTQSDWKIKWRKWTNNIRQKKRKKYVNATKSKYVGQSVKGAHNHFDLSTLLFGYRRKTKLNNKLRKRWQTENKIKNSYIQCVSLSPWILYIQQ